MTDELEIWKRLNECECVKKVREYWYEDDIYLDQLAGEGEYTYCYVLDNYEMQEPIWVPPLFHPIRPERSLWGMSEEIRDRKWSPGDCIIFASLTDRPDLAIARAIIEMEGK